MQICFEINNEIAKRIKVFKNDTVTTLCILFIIPLINRIRISRPELRDLLEFFRKTILLPPRYHYIAKKVFNN